MKQIEVTTLVKQSLDEVDNILPRLGFTLVRKSRVEDQYMIQDMSHLTRDNIIDHLQRCVLIRYLCVNGEKISKCLTYKNKEYKDGTVLSEKKINVNIDDVSKAFQLLEALGFEKLVDVKYDVVVYKKDDIEFAFQQVEGLGLLLEYESTKDFDGVDSEEILDVKKRMLDEIRSYQLDVSDDFDIKKAYELVLKRV